MSQAQHFLQYHQPVLLMFLELGRTFSEAWHSRSSLQATVDYSPSSCSQTWRIVVMETTAAGDWSQIILYQRERGEENLGTST